MAPPTPPDLSALPTLPEATADLEHPRGVEAPVRELTLAFVGEVRGEIEPCGCPTLPYGGFARRERLLERLGTHESLVHLDAGETLVKGLVTASLEERTARARDVLRLSREVGVQAWAPGPTDLLALGVDGLDAVATGRLPGPPAISATWEDDSGQLLLPPTRVVSTGELRVGIIGLSAAPTAPEVAGLVRTRDPVDAARAALATLPPDLDLVVGLGSVADADADRIAREVPGIGVLLTTRGVQADEPRQVELPDQGALVVESSDRGRYLTVVRTRLGTHSTTPVVAHPSRHTWKNLRTAREQVATLRALPPEDAPTADRLAAAKADLARQEALFDTEGRGRNLGFVASIPLAEDLDGTTHIEATVERVKAGTEVRAKVRAEEPPKVSAYAASSACVNCHISEFTRWTYSDHAKAWRSLVKRNATTNVECVGCHSTGFGQPGGFGELTSANIGRYQAVQCEMCHGPMGGHPDDPRVVSGPVTVDRCVGCHDPANSPDFDFDTYIRRATCQGGAPEVMEAVP